jgi:DeoR family fructose operon transcriptional repressor
MPYRSASYASAPACLSSCSASAAAVKLLGAAESVFIDEGSTALAVAERLLAIDRPLTVVTHSIPVAVTLANRSDTDILVVGGTLRGASMATVGSAATAMLAGFMIDVAFLGASGISIDRGLSTAEPAPRELKRVAIAVSRQRVFVGASTKFGVTSFCRYAEVRDFDVLVTDTGLSSDLASRYKAAGVRLIRA